MTTFNLKITKTEYTLNGLALDAAEHRAHQMTPVLGGIQNQDVVRHHTVLLDQAFRTAKAAWAAATPELIDRLGLVGNPTNGGFDTEYADYSLDVVRNA